MPVYTPATLYSARVYHKRFAPKVHEFAYALWALRINLNDVGALARQNLLGGTSPLSLRSQDFGPRDGSDLANWFRKQLSDNGFAATGPLELVFLPRFHGRGFAPITAWVSPEALLFEVHNTAGEAHSYLVSRHSLKSQRAWKRFWVSPFSSMHGSYEFDFAANEDRLNLCVTLYDETQRALVATLTGSGQPLTPEALKSLKANPGIQGRQTFAQILLQALKIRCKGLPFRWGPFAPRQSLSATSTRNLSDKYKKGGDA